MFRVDWLQSATDELTVAWLSADSATRKKITAASHETDRQLADDPYAQSGSRPGGRRLAIIAPLTVTFRVDPNAGTVTVVQVHVFREPAR